MFGTTSQNRQKQNKQNEFFVHSQTLLETVSWNMCQIKDGPWFHQISDLYAEFHPAERNLPLTISTHSKKFHHIIVSAIGLSALVAFSFPLHAATREEQTAACKGDALKLCMLAIPNEQKIAACLESKRDKLSPACKAMFPEKKTKKGQTTKKKDKN